MAIRKFCVGPLENNVYVVACRETSEAVIIDAADEADRILRETSDVMPVAILTTHGHWDHVQAAAEVAQRLDIPFRIHAADTELAGLDTTRPILPDERITVGVVSLHAVHTPGHTPGSTCFLVNGHAFTGDTLFPGGPGATRDAAARAQALDGIERELFSLDDATLVHPGHGLDTTVGTERPHLAAWRT